MGVGQNGCAGWVKKVVKNAFKFCQRTGSGGRQFFPAEVRSFPPPKCRAALVPLMVLLSAAGCRQAGEIRIQIPPYASSTSITAQPPITIVITNVAGVVLTNLPAQIFTNVPAPIFTNVPAPSLANISAPVLTNVAAPVLTNVAAPVLTNVTAPVLTNFPAVVLTNIQASVFTNVAAPVYTNVSAAILTNVAAPVLTNSAAPVLTNVPAPIFTNAPGSVNTNAAAPVSTASPASAPGGNAGATNTIKTSTTNPPNPEKKMNVTTWDAFWFIALAGLLGALCRWTIEINQSGSFYLWLNRIRDLWYDCANQPRLRDDQKRFAERECEKKSFITRTVAILSFEIVTRGLIGMAAAPLGPVICGLINPNIIADAKDDLIKLTTMFGISVVAAFSGQKLLLTVSQEFLKVAKTRLSGRRDEEGHGD